MFRTTIPVNSNHSDLPLRNLVLLENVDSLFYFVIVEAFDVFCADVIRMTSRQQQQQ